MTSSAAVTNILYLRERPALKKNRFTIDMCEDTSLGNYTNIPYVIFKVSEHKISKSFVGVNIHVALYLSGTVLS